MTIGKVQLAEAARKAVPTLTTEQALNIAATLETAIRKSESHDLRQARWLRKQIGKQLGAAGATIHQLRGEIALLRQQKAQMVHKGIAELIRTAVLEAVPMTFGDDGQIQGVAAVGDDGTLTPIEDAPPLVSEVDLGKDLADASATG